MKKLGSSFRTSDVVRASRQVATMEKSSTLSPAKQALLEQRLKGVAPGPVIRPEIPRRPELDSAPLSFAQRQMWVIDQITPGNPAYNLPNGYRLRGRLDVRALERGVNEIIKRHEALRTAFAVEDGEPLQRIHPELKITVKVTALDHLTGEERDSKLQALASEESVGSFDLSRLPLIRVSVFKLGDAEHVLIVNLHHIVADGLSIGLLLDELDAFYRAFTGGGDPSPPGLPVQYADFALWQRQAMADAGAHAEQIGFWRTQLGGTLPVLDLPVDRPRPALQSFKGSNVFFNVPAALARDLRALGAREGCTFFMTLLAAFQVLLQRYSGADDMVIGTPVAARTAQEVKPLIGNFLNIAALRCKLSGDPTFLELLRRSRDTTLDAFSNSDLPFEAMMQHLTFERDPSRNPVFQVMLQMLSTTAKRIGDLDVSNFHFDLKIAQFDLSLHLYEEAGAYLGRFEYCADLFYAETVKRLSSNFEQLLHAVIRDPQQRISQIPILAAPERNQILDVWNDTAADFPAGSLLHELFEAQVQRTPERTALRVGATALSYGGLDERANRIAQALRSRGVHRGQRVGLCIERGTDMLAAMLGILKAGAAYVPLDPSFPEERLRFMADDAQLTLLVSTTALAGLFGLPRERQLLLDADAKVIASAPDTRLPADAFTAQPGDPGYLIYTSGSTGKPKGVVVPHRAIVNFLTSMAREPGLTGDDVLVAVTTLSFDIAVLELQLPLTLGASAVIATRDETVDGRALGALLEQHRATVMQAAPVTWRMLLEAGWTGRAPFKALVGGETMPKDLADQLIARGVEVWNMYGPTETTVWSTCTRISDTSDGITIGKPIANTIVRILDAQKNLCPIGVPGELCIGGDGVASGYWNRPELTADRFIQDPFGTGLGATLYRTGDRARWRNDGTLEHLGRLDFQVKLRGFRIEPGEIEAGIARHPSVREAVVMVREDTPGDKRLVAYLVAENPPADLADQLRALIRTAMPEYMVPAHFVSLEALPRTHNGKIDRKALPAPGVEGAVSRVAAVAPRTATEEMVMGVFSDVLKRADFGVFENFFDLGGHSLMAARIMARLRAASSRDLPLRVLFERQTVSGLAEAIDALAWLASSKQAPAVAGNRMEIEL
jgi:amino acid adenylation domain-containing protein